MRAGTISLLLLINIICLGQVRRDMADKFRKLKITVAMGSSVVLDDGIINTEESKSFMTIYNEKGQPVEARVASIKDKNATIHKYHYGKCTDYQTWEWLEMKGGVTDTLHIQQITFDETCKPKRITWTDSTGRVTSTRHLEYDKKGRQLKETDVDSTGKTTLSVAYYYPDSFTVVKKGFFADSTFWYHTLERFDTKGNRRSITSFDDKGNKSPEGQTTEFIYKGDALQEEIVYDSKRQVLSGTTYYYNADHLIDRVVVKSSEGDKEKETITIYKYRKED